MLRVLWMSSVKRLSSWPFWDLSLSPNSIQIIKRSFWRSLKEERQTVSEKINKNRKRRAHNNVAVLSRVQRPPPFPALFTSIFSCTRTVLFSLRSIYSPPVRVSTTKCKCCLPEFPDSKREKEESFDGRRENWIQFAIPFLMLVHSSCRSLCFGNKVSKKVSVSALWSPLWL